MRISQNQTCPGVVSVPRAAGNRADVFEHHCLVGEQQVLLAAVRTRLEDTENVRRAALLAKVQAQHHEQCLVLVTQLLVTCQ